MSPVADTSFLIAFFDGDDARHAAARKVMAAAQPVVIGCETLVEMLGVLKVKADRRTALAALKSLLRMPNVEWDEHGDVLGAYEMMEAEATLSYVDAAVVQCSLRRKADLLSYDEAQIKAHQRHRGKP